MAVNRAYVLCNNLFELYRLSKVPLKLLGVLKTSLLSMMEAVLCFSAMP